MQELQDLIVQVSEKWEDLPRAKYSIGDVIVLEIVDVGADVYYPSPADVVEANEMGGLELDVKSTQIRQFEIKDALADFNRQGEPVWYYFGEFDTDKGIQPLKRFDDRDILYKI